MYFNVSRCHVSILDIKALCGYIVAAHIYPVVSCLHCGSARCEFLLQIECDRCERDFLPAPLGPFCVQPLVLEED